MDFKDVIKDFLFKNNAEFAVMQSLDENYFGFLVDGKFTAINAEFLINDRALSDNYIDLIKNNNVDIYYDDDGVYYCDNDNKEQSIKLDVLFNIVDDSCNTILKDY